MLRWLGGFLLLMLAGAPAFAAPSCIRPPGVGEPSLDFQVREAQVMLHHEVDLFGLPRLQGHMESVPSGWAIQGLTLASDQVSLQAAWKLAPQPDGGVCLWIEKVTAVLGMPEQRVYIASDYQPGSCEYEAILAHERQHVEINRRTLHDHADGIRRALWDGIRQSSPLYLSVKPSDNQLIPRRLMSYLSGETQRLQSDLRQRNGAIDTLDAYRRQQQASGCKHWRSNR